MNIKRGEQAYRETSHLQKKREGVSRTPSPGRKNLNLSNSTAKEVDLSNLNEEEMGKIMGMPLVQLKPLAKDHEEFVRIVRLAINRGIELGKGRTTLVYNNALRGRGN